MIGLMAEPLLAEQGESILARDFGAWMTSEQRRIYGLCQRFLQDRDEADSATQDVFLKAYQALIREDAKELDDPARWVTRIAVNTCLNLAARRENGKPGGACLLNGATKRRGLAMAPSRNPEAEDRCFARGDRGAGWRRR